MNNEPYGITSGSLFIQKPPHFFPSPSQSKVPRLNDTVGQVSLFLPTGRQARGEPYYKKSLIQALLCYLVVYQSRSLYFFTEKFR